MQDMNAIYKKYGEIVYKYVFCLTGNEDTTEEIVQETFLVAVKDINKFRGECKISTWLCQISKYIWYKRLKKEKSKKEVPLDVLQNTLFIQESIEDNFCNKESKIKLFKKLQSFDETTRNVMYLRIFGNFEYTEIAEIMGKTSNWARVVFFRGKQKLKEELENEK
ncbi:MAG TPA: sigma-70 family RNA polymerase sigma factor [Clostridiaceae bacterium]|jgi:RNA polymerase sigma factor, sigma-70 family|nr:sigma-70 family RNA polymerase sigma factor [Clostridia bacterium]HJJ11850.1 sigma-70 family RNA polymerase sigma factor [Clostridiaceae bacterium]